MRKISELWSVGWSFSFFMVTNRSVVLYYSKVKGVALRDALLGYNNNYLRLENDADLSSVEGLFRPSTIDILVDNDLLIFNREEMLEERVIRCRSAKRFEERYLRKGFDEQISVIRILDSRREEFRLSKAYEQKIDVVNVITAPEIEMLIIHAEGAYDQFKRSGKKPSEFCKINLRMHDVKSYDFVKQYFSNPQLLVKAIKEYRRTANIPKGEYSLSDLLR